MEDHSKDGARIGGEEFAWILPESGARGAYRVAERARAAKNQGRDATVRWSPGAGATPTRSSPEASTSGPAPPG